MLPKDRRLSRSQIAFVFKKGNKKGGQHFAIQFLPRRNGSASRFCVMVSMKVAPKAVDRNRLRRQIYAALRDLTKTQDIQPTDVIIITRPSASKLDFEGIKSHLKRLLTSLL